MSITILCTGEPKHRVSGKYSSAGFDAAIQEEMNSGILPYNGRRYNPEGKTVWIGEGRLAQDTAEKLLLPCAPIVEPLLNEISLRSFVDTETLYPLETWMRKAASQRKHGDARQAESLADLMSRANRFIDKAEQHESMVITYPLFLEELLKCLRSRGFVVQRTGLMKIQPLERFLVSRREEHCGGCQHNCFLANPGCGIGQDKAMRLRAQK